MTYLKIFITILCLTLSLNACKNSEKPKENTSPATISITKGKILEPELLISKSEAAKLLGEAVEDGKKSETKVVGQKICFYKPVNSSSRRFLQISLTQNSFMPPAGVGSETIYRETKKMIGNSKTEIKELGNDAFIAANGINILKDGYYIVISSSLVHKNDGDLTLKSAGKKALENLEQLK